MIRVSSDPFAETHTIFDKISYVKARHYGDLFKIFVKNLEAGERSTKVYIPCKQLFFRIRMTFFWAQTFTRKHIVFLLSIEKKIN